MNNGKLVGLVVLLCVICPILVGFVWPVDSTSEQAWETGDPRDISNDAINAKLPVYVPYNDPFANNMNVFDANGRFNNFPVTVTSNQGPIWNPDGPSIYPSTVHINSSGTYTINDLGTWHTWGNIPAVVITFDLAWMDSMKVGDGNNAEYVLYYPLTDKMYYKIFNVDEFLPVESHKIVFKALTGLQNTDQDLYCRYYGIDGYADLTDGMQLSYYSYWFNGYKNKGFNMVLNTVDSNLSDFIYINDPNGGTDTTVSIWINSDTIYLSLWRNSVNYDNVALGSRLIYDKVLLTVDYDSATIALSGLRGMDSFIGDYTKAIRETVTCQWRDPVIFDCLSVDGNSAHAAWYMADTLSAVAETDGSRNFNLDLRDYTRSGSCQLNIRSVQMHGDNLNFRINGNTINGTITKGELTIDGVDGPITVPVNNILIGLIGNQVFINGYLLAEYNTITEARIYFVDDWKMSLIYYPVTETSVPGYAWLPGGFGLSVAGFCSVGMITSFGSALSLGVYGRRSGARVALVSLAALLCGATYLVILMSGMS